jgi:hypothetical protein
MRRQDGDGAVELGYVSDHRLRTRGGVGDLRWSRVSVREWERG